MLAMEEYVTKLSETLQLPEEVISSGKAVMHKIFEVITNKRSQSRYRIDRCDLVGGAEKKTSIYLKVDFDCIIVVNNVTVQDFPKILDYFEDILLANFEINECDIHKKPEKLPKTLTFTLQGVDFDLALAMAPGVKTEAEARGLVLQAKELEARQDFEAAKKFMKMHNELSEIAVLFVKKQDSFTHEFIRLCKYWNSSLHFELVTNDSYIYGRSSIIELVAIFAAKQCPRNKYCAFKIFLQTMRNINNIRIAFTDSYYNLDQIPSRSKEIPYLIDPANPYHNYLAGVRDFVKDQFSQFALKTLRRLESNNDSMLLFDPQPEWPNLATKPKDWLVGMVDDVNTKKPTLEFNSNLPGRMKNEKKVGCMKNYLAVLVKNIETWRDHESQSRQNSATYVKDRTTDAIDRLLIGCKSNWTDSSVVHSSRMTTITIPLCDGSRKAARVSCNWE